MSSYFDRLAQRSGLSLRAGAGVHNKTADVGLSTNELGDDGRTRSLEVHVENIIQNNANPAPVRSETTQWSQAQPDSPSPDRDSQQRIDRIALTQKSKPDSVTTSQNRSAPPGSVSPAQRISPQSAARLQTNNAPDESVQAIANPVHVSITNIETPAISDPRPDIAETQYTAAEPLRSAHRIDAAQSAISTQAAAESSPYARRDSRPFAAQQDLVQLDSRNDGPPSSQRSIVIKTDSHDRRHAVAAGEVRADVAGNAIRKTEVNRSSHAGNIKISIGKIDLQVHQQPDRSVPVPSPVRTRERPSKPSMPGDNNRGAIGNGSMSRYYFRWY